MKKILPVAVLAALAGVSGAQATHVNSDGLGQVLLYPLYTTEAGQDTYINLANTTDTYKAVKIRILESMNSREVLDFNLYMSPGDHWSATISANDAGGASLKSGDNTCTVPVAVSLGESIPFRTLEFDGTVGVADSVAGVERTKEGYVEVIEMATIVDTAIVDNFNEAILHNAEGIPGNCVTLDTAWALGGRWDVSDTDGTSAPTGGLYGYGVLINVDEGTDVTYDAIAIDDFYDPITGVVHTDPGSLDPSLGNANAAYDVIDGNTVFSDSAASGLDAVSAVLMHSALANDYVLEPDIDAGTDWVITFPTKRDYVATAPAIAPFLSVWDPKTSTACEEFALAYVDREEQSPNTPPPGNDFSPRPPGLAPDVFALCAEANIMSFNESNVLGASARSGSNFNLAAEYYNGWAVMSFSQVGRELVAGANTFVGLPVVGFAVQKYVNGDVGGLLSNYAGSVTHKTTTTVNP